MATRLIRYGQLFMDLVYETTNVKEYVVESTSRDVSGTPVYESLVVTAEDYAKDCKGMLKINEDGTVDYQACFVAGTLVHTKQGLMPIEDVRPGTLVLTQPEQGGGIGYRPVIKKMAHLDQPVYAVQIEVEGVQELTTVIATPNHPFWVEEPLAHGEHWMATENLEPGFVLQLVDGRKAHVHAAGMIRCTQYEHIAFAADDRSGIGIVLDIGDKHIKVADSTTSLNLGKLDLGQPYLTSVYNFAVDEFHTCYAGEAGVWVHNSGCTPEGAINASLSKADSLCFEEDTLVQTPDGVMYEIKYLKVGDLVLSRCEKTGVQAYRRVVKKFEHQCDESVIVHFVTERGTVSAVSTTEEHPFWVESVGWVPAGQLIAGQKLSIVDPIDVTDEYRSEDEKKVKLAMGGGRWHAEVLGVTRRNNVREYAGEVYRDTVYNIEVEEFHTYFVGWNGIWVHNKDTQNLKPLDRSTSENKPVGYYDNPDKYASPKKENIVAHNHVLGEIEGECFVGDTLVWIKPWVSKFTGVRHEQSYIEDIEVGDEVLSRCEITGEMAYKKVTKVFAHGYAKVSVIGCDYGPEYYAKFGPARYAILTTANHPFWVEGKGWTKVRDLQAGDEFLTHNGAKAAFRIADLDAFEDEVFNLEVEDYHTYFVGPAGIWVHNKSPIEFNQLDSNTRMGFSPSNASDTLQH
jgi:hypothetical protein